MTLQNSIVLSQTWEEKSSSTDYILFDISIPSGQNNIAYATGSQFTTGDSEGIIIKSEDAGETWSKIYPSEGETGLNLQKIEFVNENKGFAVGYNGTFLKTEDGGNSWVSLTPAADIYVYNNLNFFDENQGVFMAVTNPGILLVYTTSDGGETWTESENSPNVAIVDIDYGDASTMYAVGYNGTVSKSENAGNIWNLISQPGWAINVGVTFQDENNGFYAGEEGDLHFTSDGGENWTESLFTGWHHFTGLAYKGIQAFATGTDEDVYLSYDNGVNWENIYNGTGQSHLYEVAFFDNGYGLICGSQGKMLKFSPIFASDLIVSTIDGTDNEIEVDESLQLQAQVLPENLNQAVVWSIISGDNYISIDQNGLVTGLNVGTAIVRATSVLDNTIYGEFEIIVSDGGMGISETASQNIAIHPNPVKNVLNISSKKSIDSVSAYNVAGQKVISNAKVSNGQINVSALISGTYIFKVTLEGGQIETFKIFKK